MYMYNMYGKRIGKHPYFAISLVVPYTLSCFKENDSFFFNMKLTTSLNLSQGT